MAGLDLQSSSLRQTATGFEGEYQIHIDTWAGRSVLELYVDTWLADAITLDIRPSARKLDQNEFDTMLDELSERSSSLVWGLSPGAAQGVEGGKSPAIVHPVVVDALLPQFERLLARFLEDPPLLTLRERGLKRFDRSKKPDLATVRWLGRRPEILRALSGRRTAQTYSPWETVIDQPVVRTTANHPVTRYVKHLLRRVVSRLHGNAEMLRRRRGRFSDPAGDAYAERMAARLQGAALRLHAISERPIFKSVASEPPSETAIQSLADHPLHAALHRVGRRLLDPGLAYAPGGNLEAALKRTYDLFELMVLYRLADEIPRQLGPAWSLTRAAVLPYQGREERVGDRASWWFTGPDGLSIELRYQQWFPRARQLADDRMFSSLSGVNVPDYVAILRKGRSIERWVILDAKYRSGRQPVDQGLGDIHRYRDALRIRGKSASGAFIIVPRLAEQKAVYGQSQYHNEHAFGALQLYEPCWSTPLFRVLGLEPVVACGVVVDAPEE